jgi:hypothetical protein
MSDKLKLFDSEVTFDQDRTTNELIIKRHQYIPDDFIDDLKSNKMDSRNRRSGDMLLMASIPTSVVEFLKNDHYFQYDVMNEPISKTLKLLKVLGMDAFITSDKQI